TAWELARRGAAVVLGARTEDALREVADGINRRGGTAVALPTDVANWHDVERLADDALRRFGRIDTWVNDAGVAVYAPVEQTTPEEAEQVIRTDLMGVIHGSKAALPVMRRQGFGTIINVGSELSYFGVPL